jgi:PAS domain S-box-containing protein
MNTYTGAIAIAKAKANELIVATGKKKKIILDPVIDAGESNKDEDYIGHLAAIIESSEDAIISKSLDGIVTSWNKSAERMFGYTSAEIIGKNVSLIIPPEYINEEKEILKRIRNNESIVHFETLRLRKNGERLHVSLSVSPIKDRKGNIIGISKIARDITLQKKADAELEYANKGLSLQNIVEEKQAAELLIANKELAFQNKEKGNRAAELLIANKELAFQSDEKANRAAELLIANKELVFQNKEKGNRAAELLIANKELAFQSDEKANRAAELLIANKELVFQNAEKEKRAAELIIINKELAIKNKESSKEVTDYKYALDESSNLAITNQKGIITHVNENFCNISKYSVDELVGQDHRILNSGHHSKEFIRNLWNTIASGKIWRGELKNKAKDGTMYWVDTTIVPFLNSKGIPYQYVAIRSDITKRKLAEVEYETLNEELEQRIKYRTEELEAFSYSVSHDLRAPLRAIHGYAKMFKETYENKLDAEGDRLMNNILNNAKKMGQLIDDLLSFSRIGRNELVKREISMHDMVMNLSSELKDEQPDRIIEFHIKHLLPAQADNIAIRQVWLNLISNAIKYSKHKEKAIIEIDSYIKGNEIIYYIKDNGAGFDMRYANKLFGVFQRLHSDDEFEGTGVGLALVQRIIKKHGGRVWAEGKVNEGATFYFTLNNL